MAPSNAIKGPLGNRGFTLIEVLLVLGILGVLVGVALPKYQDYRERIKQTQAIQDITILQGVIKTHYLNAGAYPTSLAEVGNGGRLDPWGRAYVYQELAGVKGKGKARKNRKENPINSDFDLYSLGKDGVSKAQLSNKDSLDDVVRASDGAYIGLAANYTQ